MTKKSEEYTECPHCLEEIRKGALKCKHCESFQPAKRLTHDGTCPYCLENIKPSATICRHCKSRLNEKIGCDCNPDRDHTAQTSFLPIFQPGLSGVSPGFIWGQRCITLNVPICKWTEDVDTIGGFHNGRWECHLERRTICTPSWW